MLTRVRRPPWGLRLHAGLVAGLLALFAVLRLSADGVDANIGAGLVGLPLIGLGLPWSWLHVADPSVYDALPGVLRWPAVFGPAVLNVVLHGLAVRWWRARPGTGRDHPGT